MKTQSEATRWVPPTRSPFETPEDYELFQRRTGAPSAGTVDSTSPRVQCGLQVQSKFKLPLPPKHGINHWVMSAARHLRNQGAEAHEAIEVIFAYDGQLRRRFKSREVERAVNKVWGTTLKGNRPGPDAILPGWNQAETARLAKDEPLSVDELKEKSQEIPEQKELLRDLFPDVEGLLCIGASFWSFRTMKLTEFSDLTSKQLIVPAYMLSATGRTLEGKLSVHTKENTGPREYLVMDFDSPSPEEQLAVIGKLSKFRGPVLILHSGGKSYHAWFRASENPDDDELFWRLGITLGADPALYRSGSSFVRLPMGLRDNGNRQQVYYFDPAASSDNLGNISDYLSSIGVLAAEKVLSSFKFYTVNDFESFDDEKQLVEGLLGAGSTSVVYGPSGCRKTFWVLSIAAHVASGKPWRERRVLQGGVIYLSLEGETGFKRRMQALKAHGVLETDTPLYVSFDPMSLPLDAQRLAESVKAVCDGKGVTPVLVVIDTLARSMAGGDENSAKDMAEVIQAIELIRTSTGAHVMVVHHAGKDEGRGARGHSSLRAAVDTEIKFTKREEISVAEIQKQRDLEEVEPMPFSLQEVILGKDEEGRQVISAVAIQMDEGFKPAPADRDSLSSPDALLDLLPAASVEDWAAKALEERGISRSKFFELKKKLRASSFEKRGGNLYKVEKS